MEEKILEILKVVFDLDSIDKNISQANCDKWDSLKHLILIVELEGEFDVEFEPEEIAEMKNFGDIKRILAVKLQ